MTDLLLKLFVKNSKNSGDVKVRQSVGTLASITSIICNILLSAAKMLVGMLFGVISVFADGVNNLTDCATNVVSLISIKLANKPADKNHPYGHQRVEYIATTIVGFVVLIVAYELASQSIQEIIAPQQTEFAWWTVGALALSVIVKLWMGVFNRKLGKRYNSELLLATATDSIGDVCATSAVLVSVFVSKWTGFVLLDGIMGCVVAVVIAVAGIGILKDTLNQLLGQAPDAQLIEDINNRICSYQGVIGTHDLNVHNYGPNKYYASVHVEVDSKVDVVDSHDLIDRIERDFAEHTDTIMVIHMDPVVVGDKELDCYKTEVLQIVRQLDERFQIHDFRMVKGPTHTNLIFDVATHFDTKLQDSQIKDFIQQEITKLHADVYVVPTVEKQIK